MPGIVTHHMFGVDVYGSRPQLIGETQSALDAFLLGNLGPDPFFYLTASSLLRKHRRLGQILHKEKTPQLLFFIHEHFVADESRRESAEHKAYALGFLCHYLLDSTVHPLVYAQQHAVCNTHLEELTGEWSHRVVHATIETSLDEYMLTTRLGASAATLPPHKTMLRCPTPVLLGLSQSFSPVLKNTYGLRIPETTFTSAVSLNRLAQQVLDSKSAGVRQHFDYLAGLGMASSYIQALSHRGKLSPRTPFTNDDHIPWKVPFTEKTVINFSFDELFAETLCRAQEVLPLYAQANFALDACTALVSNVNFLGRPVE